MHISLLFSVLGPLFSFPYELFYTVIPLNQWYLKAARISQYLLPPCWDIKAPSGSLIISTNEVMLSTLHLGLLVKVPGAWWMNKRCRIKKPPRAKLPKVSDRAGGWRWIQRGRVAGSRSGFRCPSFRGPTDQCHLPRVFETLRVESHPEMENGDYHRAPVFSP